MRRCHVVQPVRLGRGRLPVTHIGAPTPATAAPTTRKGTGFALAALCTLLFLTFLDNTVVSVALGDVQSTLGAGVQALQWVVNGYALVFASVMLAAGAIGDEFGHRKVMLAGAGVPQGAVYGSSDAHGAYPKENPVSPADLAATIYTLLGLDPNTEIHDPQGRPFTLALGQPVKELLG